MGRTPKAGPPDEKVTVNLGPVDLGKIDLLVEEGFFASRADFIRAAVRRLADENRRVLDEAALRREMTIGFVSHSRSSLEQLRGEGRRLAVRVVGIFQLNADVDPDLADDVLESVWVLGTFRASDEVKKRLGPKLARDKGEAA